MNKFLAIVALCVAASQLVAAQPRPDGEDQEAFSQAAGESGDSETSSLIGAERLFNDYCIQQRDYIRGDIQSQSRNAASSLLRQIFSNSGDYASDLIGLEREATEQLAAQIQNPDLPIDGEKLDENEISRLIEEGKKEIAQKGDHTFGLAPAGKTAVKVLYSAVNSAIFVNLAKARSYLTGATLKEAINSFCAKVNEYEGHIIQELDQAKSQLVRPQDQNNPIAIGVQVFLKDVSVNSLHCQTTKNVVRLNAFCELFQSGRGAFFKMLGISGF